MFAQALTKATAILAFTGVGVNTNTFTLNGTTYTLQTVLVDAPGNILIGADQTATCNNIVSAIMGTAGAGTLYGTGTAAPTGVNLAVRTSTSVTFTATTAGTAANSFASTETCTNATFTNGATFSGGVAAAFDFSVAATLVGTFTDRTAVTLTLNGALGTDRYMLGTTATTYRYQQLYRLTATERDGMVVMHDGFVAPATQLTVSDVNHIDILFPGGTLRTSAGAMGEEHSAANWLKKLRNSMGRIHVLVTDALPGTAETDPYTNLYYGKVKTTNYRNSQGKDSEREFLTGIDVYHTVATTRVPVGDTDVS